MSGRQNEYQVDTKNGDSYKVTTPDHHDNQSWTKTVADSLHRVASNEGFKDLASFCGGITGIAKVGEMANEYLGPKKANEVEKLLKEILDEMRRRPMR